MEIQVPKLLYYSGKPVSSKGIWITPEEANKVFQDLKKQVKNRKGLFKHGNKVDR